jgi:hypothetical protein
MHAHFACWLVFAALLALAIAASSAAPAKQPAKTAPQAQPSAPKALKTITLNTGAYIVGPGADKRSEHIVAQQDMHIVMLSHFTGVQTGGFPTDNGHILSTSPENPWVKWEGAATGMEPTGSEGYFGYCGRDYYSECTGISDVQFLEPFPAGTYILVKKGETLWMHTYTGNGTDRALAFHHCVRVYYW